MTQEEFKLYWAYWNSMLYHKLVPYTPYFGDGSIPPEPPVPPEPDINVFPYGGFLTETTDFKQSSPEWDLLHLD